MEVKQRALEAERPEGADGDDEDEDEDETFSMQRRESLGLKHNLSREFMARVLRLERRNPCNGSETLPGFEPAP